MASNRWRVLVAAAGAVWLGVPLGCGRGPAVPDPAPVVAAYAEAVGEGDAEAIYGMMSEESRRALSRDELRRLLGEQQAELGEHAARLRSPERAIEARARLRYADGEVVSLDVEDGQFKLTAADALPAGARTPAQALAQLRVVLARRSYAGLLRVLSPRTRSALENDLRSLVEGLGEPEALPVELKGDVATVVVPGGHRVHLRREHGIWHVDDFD